MFGDIIYRLVISSVHWVLTSEASRKAKLVRSEELEFVWEVIETLETAAAVVEARVVVEYVSLGVVSKVSVTIVVVSVVEVEDTELLEAEVEKVSAGSLVVEALVSVSVSVVSVSVVSAFVSDTSVLVDSGAEAVILLVLAYLDWHKL